MEIVLQREHYYHEEKYIKYIQTKNSCNISGNVYKQDVNCIIVEKMLYNIYGGKVKTNSEYLLFAEAETKIVNEEDNKK